MHQKRCFLILQIEQKGKCQNDSIIDKAISISARIYIR